MTLLAARDEVQLRQLLYTLSVQAPKGPVAIRYPRGYGAIEDWQQPFEVIDYTKGSCLKEGNELAILSVGTTALTVSEALQERSDAERIAHFDLGPIKPLDETLLKAVFTQYKNIIIVEEAALAGGVGSSVLSWAVGHGFQPKIKRIGLPDIFVPHGATPVLKEKFGIDAQGIHRAIDDLMK